MGGPILARGYLKDEAKPTAYIAVGPPWLPTRSLTPRRMYRGLVDLVRYDSDSTFVYVGRQDTHGPAYVVEPGVEAGVSSVRSIFPHRAGIFHIAKTCN